MDIRISGYGDNAVLELPPYSVGQTKSHVAVRQISTYTLIDYNGNYGTEVVLISGQRVLAGCWPEDLSKAITVATRIYETGDIAIPDEVVDLRLLLESQQECDRLRAEVEALRKDAQRYQYIKNKRGGIGWMLTTWEDFDLDAAIDHSLCGEGE